jgi:hypothetical protein
VFVIPRCGDDRAIDAHTRQFIEKLVTKHHLRLIWISRFGAVYNHRLLQKIQSIFSCSYL